MTSYFDIFYNSDSLANFYTEIYEILYNIIDIALNYCPLQYQLLYFYFPIMYILKKKNYESNSTLNYIFIKILFLFKKCLNTNSVFFLIRIFLSKIYFFLKIVFLVKIQAYVNIFLEFFSKNLKWITWKPIFKKLSYFGVFAYIRTKWFKNK